MTATITPQEQPGQAQRHIDDSDDGHASSPVPAGLDVRHVDGGVEEHLRDDEVRAGVHFLLDVRHLHLEVSV